MGWADGLFQGFGWRGGFGIMFDDLVAAFCTLLVIAVWRFWCMSRRDDATGTRPCWTRGWMLATAESCTGGMIAAACTDLAGSSNWFERGFVTYSERSQDRVAGRGCGTDRTRTAR